MNMCSKCPPPAHTHDLSSQMVTPLVNLSVRDVLVNVKPKVCIKRLWRSLMSWIFVSYTHCCMTPLISKFKAQAYDDPGQLWWSYDTSDAIFFGNTNAAFQTARKSEFPSSFFRVPSSQVGLLLSGPSSNWEFTSSRDLFTSLNSEIRTSEQSGTRH